MKGTKTKQDLSVSSDRVFTVLKSQYIPIDVGQVKYTRTKKRVDGWLRAMQKVRVCYNRRLKPDRWKVFPLLLFLVLGTRVLIVHLSQQQYQH